MHKPFEEWIEELIEDNEAESFTSLCAIVGAVGSAILFPVSIAFHTSVNKVEIIIEASYRVHIEKVTGGFVASFWTEDNQYPRVSAIESLKDISEALLEFLRYEKLIK